MCAPLDFTLPGMKPGLIKTDVEGSIDQVFLGVSDTLEFLEVAADGGHIVYSREAPEKTRSETPLLVKQE